MSNAEPRFLALERAARELFSSRHPSIVNDYLTHADVLRMLDHAIELAPE